MLKTPENIIEDIKKRITYTNPVIDTVTGNVTTDLGVEAFAEELSSCYTEEDRIRQLYLWDASAFTDAEAEALANSFGVYKLNSTAGTGEVTFGALTKPATGAVYTIPVGTTVTTGSDSTTTQSYVTTTVGTIDSNAILNPNTNYYECTVSIQATNTGTTSNVAAGAINTLETTLAGVSIVYNANAIVNGTAIETKDSLLERTKLSLRGYVYGTIPSYLAAVLADPVITDAIVVDPDSEFSVRGPGTIDIYILGTTNASYTQHITTQAQSEYLTKTPIISTGTAVAVFNDGTTIVEGNGFTLIPDTDTIYARSSEAKDQIVWTTAVYESVVLTHTYYDLTYTYNKLVGDTQTSMDTESKRIVTADVLVRDTSAVQVSMDFDIVVLTGYDTTYVINNCVYAIQTYINNFSLNQTLRQSDIIGLVEGIAGVDYIKLPMRQFNLKGVTGVGDVASSPLEYLRVEASDILIS
jgi:uncharacterized phage protein gp47/JayE